MIDEPTATGTTRHRTRVLIASAVGGLLLAWTGGFLLSSSYDVCVDGPRVSKCYGRFASGAWHGMGAVLLAMGLTLSLAALVQLMRECRNRPYGS